ncbi:MULTISPECIES: hypothetical protein [unclassified Acinetobacter]|uniref:hypothetical protein n=1 Tax=unclassified Acinetobacter TaxID=196816 RepID=UPI0015D43154|nr:MULTISPECIES: hypothetical protein [unclassified Acinetobacter]UUS56969.1 hypothetical protein MST16_12980 [Acinetobacter sp. YH16040_T]
MTTLNIEKKANPLLSDEAQELLCFATISESKSWKDVLNLYLEIKAKNAPKKVLMLLEDIGQCEYTSMHASMGDGLYFDTSEIIEEGEDEDISYDNTLPFQVKYHIDQLLRSENKVNIHDLHGKFNYSDQDLSVLLKINEQPEKILDEVIQIKLVNSENDHEKFAAQLNGYFSCDLSPFESFSLIQYLDKNFDLEYVGLGASLLFFIKKPSFTLEKLDSLFEELDNIYSYNQETSSRLKRHLSDHNYMILPYVDSLDIFDLDG